MLALLAALLLGAVLLAQYARARLHITSLLAAVPGPSYPLPILGNLLHMLGPMDNILARGLHIYDQYGPGPIKFWLGETPSVQLMRPEDIEPILSSQREVEKPELIYKPVRGFFGQGLITLNGDAWFAHRRALTPAFHFSVLERYAGIFTRRGAAFAKQLAADVPAGQSFDIMKFHSAFVTETVMETAFGIPPDVLVREKSEVGEFVKATNDAFSVIVHRIFHPWLLVDAIFKMSPIGRTHARCEEIITAYAKKVIAAKKAELEERRLRGGGDDHDGEETEEGVRKKYTFLDMALGGRAGVLTDEEVLNEVRTLIAVQQTSASTLSFIMVMLALHPDVQELARREVREVDATEGLHPLERLKRLKYLERVIKETMRLYPITAIFSRKLKSDDVLTCSVTPRSPSPGTRCRPACWPPCSCTRRTATPGTGPTRSASTRTASCPTTAWAATRTRTCPLARGRGTASASATPCCR
ncbi:hypothetical protein ONE63_009454 [Megalurothrips usitatus]|uniref:Cytochrome P450 4C1-like n=1 Tax=Megalurothrips usitatus TaxID=439358 RepID=A0AAV7XJN0_9NEOP|nr:hypothetical protein ONE63_009454 [Megalurothrips usitatus]